MRRLRRRCLRGRLSTDIRNYGDVFRSCGEEYAFVGDLAEKCMTILASEGPLEGRSGAFVVALNARRRCFSSAREEKSLGVRTFLWTIEK